MSNLLQKIAHLSSPNLVWKWYFVSNDGRFYGERNSF